MSTLPSPAPSLGPCLAKAVREILAEVSLEYEREMFDIIEFTRIEVIEVVVEVVVELVVVVIVVVRGGVSVWMLQPHSLRTDQILI